MRGKVNMLQQINQPRAMKKLYALGKKRPLDLSLSENPLGCSLLVSGALKNIELEVSSYPAPNGANLKKILANKFDLDEANFFVANGSESIINDLPRVIGDIGDEVVIPSLTFPMFKICSQLAGKKIVQTDMSENLNINLSKVTRLVTEKTSLIFICNPNNPTGNVLLKMEILNLLDSISKKIVLVVDEANIEFGGESLVDEVKRRKNLLVLRTLSKGFGLASLRIGFAVANPKIIQKLEEETPVFQISGLSEILAAIALEDESFIAETKRFVANQREFLRKGLEALGFVVFPSQANNLFVQVPNFLESKLFVEQLEKKGISLVLGSSFDGFDDTFFRVSVRDEQTNRLFLKKMKEIVEIQI